MSILEMTSIRIQHLLVTLFLMNFGLQAQPLADFHLVHFSLTNKVDKNADKPVPNIWIDTNMKAQAPQGGGKIFSIKPYHLGFDFTDEDKDYQFLEISRVKITYDDGVVEKSIDQLNLPYRIQPRIIETVNSVAGGRVVRGKVNHLHGKLSKVITRDESFKLELEGFFKAAHGEEIPFKIEYDYAIEIKKGKKPLIDD